MTYKLNGYKVFIASPGGLEDERRAFAKEIEDYNRIEALDRGVFFQSVGWEDTLPGLGRPQSIINEELRQCDYFILVLHDRWGSNPGTNKKNASSGTEEEYLIAMDCIQGSDFPMRQIVCLFKSVPPNQIADPGEQLQKVLNFKRQIGDEKKLLYSNFLSISEFTVLIRKNLSKWLREDDSEQEGGYVFPKDPPDLLDDRSPLSALDSTDPKDIELKNDIDAAWSLVREGKLVDAEIEFSKALIKSPTEYQLLNFSKFLIDLGQMEKAMVMIDRAIHLAKLGDNLVEEALSYLYKGIILRTRGDLDGAEKMFKKSLVINERLGQQEGMATTYGNLGKVFHTRGDLNGAEKMIRKSLTINKKLGCQEGMANQYGNLGIVLKTRGDLDGAEEMYKKSLAINEKLGRQKGMASNYGNLGNVLQTRGDLDGAEKMIRKSLTINKKLGRQEGMASNYGNLGNVLQTRGDLDGAEEMHKKSLAIEEKLGRQEGMASDYGNLGNVLQTRGDLDGAEEMYKKSMVINEKLGRQEGMASNYGNLGIVLKTRGDLDGAEEMYKKSLAIAEKVGLDLIKDLVRRNLRLLKRDKK